MLGRAMPVRATARPPTHTMLDPPCMPRALPQLPSAHFLQPLRVIGQEHPPELGTDPMPAAPTIEATPNQVQPCPYQHRCQQCRAREKQTPKSSLPPWARGYI